VTHKNKNKKTLKKPHIHLWFIRFVMFLNEECPEYLNTNYLKLF